MFYLITFGHNKDQNCKLKMLPMRPSYTLKRITIEYLTYMKKTMLTVLSCLGENSSSPLLQFAASFRDSFVLRYIAHMENTTKERPIIEFSLCIPVKRSRMNHLYVGNEREKIRPTFSITNVSV